MTTLPVDTPSFFCMSSSRNLKWRSRLNQIKPHWIFELMSCAQLLVGRAVFHVSDGFIFIRRLHLTLFPVGNQKPTRSWKWKSWDVMKSSIEFGFVNIWVCRNLGNMVSQRGSRAVLQLWTTITTNCNPRVGVVCLLIFQYFSFRVLIPPTPTFTTRIRRTGENLAHFLVMKGQLCVNKQQSMLGLWTGSFWKCSSRGMLCSPAHRRDAPACYSCGSGARWATPGGRGSGRRSWRSGRSLWTPCWPPRVRMLYF